MNSYSVAHVSAEKIIKTTKSLTVCLVYNNYDIHFNIVCRRTEMMHQQRVSCSGLCVIEHAVGEWHQCLPLTFVLQKDILSTCCNTDNVIKHV